MARCGNCSADLQPGWKFCIFCGHPVDPSHAPHPAVPAAIRPEPAPEARPRRRVDVPLILGILLGIGGFALIVYLVVMFGGAA